MDFEVKLTDIFEGPMDLLLYLVRKQELDICNLPLSRITEQYLEFIKILEFLDFNEIGEFIWVAAQLIEIKSRQILPDAEAIEQDEVEQDKTNFIEHLIEYKKYRDAAADLEQCREQMQHNYPRLANDLPPRATKTASEPIKRVELWDLVSAFGRIVKESQVDPQSRIVNKEPPIYVYMQKIQEKLKTQGSTTFSELFLPGMKRTALIGTFLGAMELIRHFGVQAQQYELFGEIWISKGEHWTENLDLSQVDAYGSSPTQAV